MCMLQSCFMCKLRLIRKNSRNTFSKIISKFFCIFFMGHFQETGNGFRIECVDIGLIIKPDIISGNFQICIPGIISFRTDVSFFQYLIIIHGSIFIQTYSITLQQGPFLTSDDNRCRNITPSLLRYPFRDLFRGKNEKTHPISGIFRHIAATIPGWPPILIIQPGQHLFFFQFFMCISNPV